MVYNPTEVFLGNFTPNDGTIDFYLRVSSLINSESVVLDLGAGRAAWYEDDNCNTRKTIRNLMNKSKELIAADIDEAVLKNKASHHQVLLDENFHNSYNNYFDIIVCDYVLEHVEDKSQFYEMINSKLKPGGWFCSRTPHKYNYISIASRLSANKNHLSILRYLQPSRKIIDVFPTFYKLNTLSELRTKFNNYNCRSFIYRTEPSYYFNSKFIYTLQHVMHRFMPLTLCGNIFSFLQKHDL